MTSIDRSIPILIVDDFSTMRRCIKTCLNRLGFVNIQEAESGSQALDKLHSEKFQLILSDWSMPEMMGMELLKAVKSSEDLNKIPFVMITSEMRKEAGEEALKEGANGSLMKPFNEAALEKTLLEIFERH
jgi:two-component system chemotaxis response regulator CheY